VNTYVIVIYYGIIEKKVQAIISTIAIYRLKLGSRG
jgi:hypothetical protein